MKKYVIFLLLICIAFIIACGKKKVDEIATVGDIIITKKDLEKRINEYSLGEAKLTREAIETILNELIEQALILCRAKELGINVSDEEITSFQNNIANIGGDIDKERARTELIIQKTIDLDVSQHINISKIDTETSNISDTEMVIFSEITAESEETINKITEMLTGGADFTSTIENIPDIEPTTKSSTTGPIPLSSLPKEFQETLKNLPEGGISSPIKSPYGYHILRLDGILEEGKETTTSTEDKIREEFLKTYQKWIDELMKKIYVSINKDALNTFLTGKDKSK
ncbi:MAG: peptidylprolyl isomerase [bacterium]